MEDKKYLFGKVLDRIDLYINNINNKSSFLIAFNTFLLGALIFKYSEIIALFKSKEIIVIVYCIVATCFIGISLSLFFCIRAMRPYLNSGNKQGEYDSLIFFGSISKFNFETFKNKCNSLTSDSLIEDLINQNYTLAKGLKMKYDFISKSFYFLLYFQLLPLVLLFGLRMLDWVIK